MTEEFQGLDLVGLLDLLEPTPEPPPIAMTPQTPGWIVVGIALLALVYWLVMRWRHHLQATAYRRAAISELDGLSGDVVGIATLLRRAALAGFPREQVAGLTGSDWLKFLDHTGNTTAFSKGPGQQLLSAPYSAEPVQPDPDLQRLARDWIRTHRALPEGTT